MKLLDALNFQPFDVFWDFLLKREDYEILDIGVAQIKIKGNELSSLDAKCFNSIVKTRERREEFVAFVKEASGYFLTFDNVTIGMAYNEATINISISSLIKDK